MSAQKGLRDINSFGGVAAEDDAVLKYFLTTDAVNRIYSGEIFLVLGRKGSGKTALVRHFVEGDVDQERRTLSRSLNLGRYPWNVHATRVDKGASVIESYVSSWLYLIAVEFSALVLVSSNKGLTLPAAKSIDYFLRQNYGRINVQLDEILQPTKLKLSSLSFEPEILGNKLGSISLERTEDETRFGAELNSLSRLLTDSACRLASENGLSDIFLHFDELDRGLSKIDTTNSLMLTGLILAARSFVSLVKSSRVKIRPIIYLRTDIWDDLKFSDKNKINVGWSLLLDWDQASLRKLVDLRISSQLGTGFTWEQVTTSQLMRGSQTKWNHVIARTFHRPRDVISFMNAILEEFKKREPEHLTIDNKDIVAARTRYSRYLKQELDDEIGPHWDNWELALQACSAIQTITFDKTQFEEQFNARLGETRMTTVDDALQILFNFSVIGYERRSGYGGTGWVFRYADPEVGWDSSATRFKVHLGLKEYAKLREERSSGFEYELFSTFDPPSTDRSETKT